MKTKKISWNELEKGCKFLAKELSDFRPFTIIAISRGGCVVATILSHLLKCEMAVVSAKSYAHYNQDTYKSNCRIAFLRRFRRHERILLVDDCIDNSLTMRKTLRWLHSKLKYNIIRSATLYNKNKKRAVNFYYKKINKDVWLKFPYEVK